MADSILCGYHLLACAGDIDRVGVGIDHGSQVCILGIVDVGAIDSIHLQKIDSVLQSRECLVVVEAVVPHLSGIAAVVASCTVVAAIGLAFPSREALAEVGVGEQHGDVGSGHISCCYGFHKETLEPLQLDLYLLGREKLLGGDIGVRAIGEVVAGGYVFSQIFPQQVAGCAVHAGIGSQIGLYLVLLLLQHFVCRYGRVDVGLQGFQLTYQIQCLLHFGALPQLFEGGPIVIEQR